MKTSKLLMFLAFIFCVSLSQTTAAVSQSNAIVKTTVTKDTKANKKSIRKALKKQWTKVAKVKKDVKKFLKDQKENASVGKLLLLALVGLGLIGVGALLDIGILSSIGSLLVLIAIIWWILDLLDII